MSTESVSRANSPWPALFDLSTVEHRELIDLRQPWLAVKNLGEYIAALLAGPYKPGIHSPVPESAIIGRDVYLGPDCLVEPGVYIKGPVWIGPGCTLRQGLYCRENVLAEAGAFLGHACEIKNAFLMPGAEAPHFNYVGDSVLGVKAHLGAGVILSNVRLDKKSVRISLPGITVDTGLEKFGALIGDRCEIGCNSVINPGSVMGRGSLLYPLSRWAGVMPEGTVYKA